MSDETKRQSRSYGGYAGLGIGLGAALMAGYRYYSSHELSAQNNGVPTAFAQACLLDYNVYIGSVSDLAGALTRPDAVVKWETVPGGYILRQTIDDRLTKSTKETAISLLDADPGLVPTMEGKGPLPCGPKSLVVGRMVLQGQVIEQRLSGIYALQMTGSFRESKRREQARQVTNSTASQAPTQGPSPSGGQASAAPDDFLLDPFRAARAGQWQTTEVIFGNDQVDPASVYVAPDRRFAILTKWENCGSSCGDQGSNLVITFILNPGEGRDLKIVEGATSIPNAPIRFAIDNSAPETSSPIVFNGDGFAGNIRYTGRGFSFTDQSHWDPKICSTAFERLISGGSEIKVSLGSMTYTAPTDKSYSVSASCGGQ